MITMNSFTLEPESLLRAELAAAERVLRSGWYVLGKEVEAFEAFPSEGAPALTRYVRWDDSVIKLRLVKL